MNNREKRRRKAEAKAAAKAKVPTASPKAPTATANNPVVVKMEPQQKADQIPAPISESGTAKATPSYSITKAQIITWALTSLGILLTAGSLTVALCAFKASQNAVRISEHQAEINERQEKINQHNQDLASGKTTATFDFIDLDEMNSPALTRSIVKKDTGWPRIDDIDELERWSPRWRIENNGDEVIDSLKVEVVLLPGRKDFLTPPGLTPTRTKTNPTRRDVALLGTLKPKHKAALYLYPCFVDQMMAVQGESNNDRGDTFQISVFAHIVGTPANAYNRPQKIHPLKFVFNWRPTGFADIEKCKEAAKREIQVRIYHGDRE
jgi:hypothetical protein